MSFPNFAEHSANLEQMLQRTKNKQKYGVNSYKVASTKSYVVKEPRVPSKANLALLKRAESSISSTSARSRSSVFSTKDPKTELQRQRNLENRQKYSPGNLRLARKSAQPPIPKPDLKQNSKVCVCLEPTFVLVKFKKIQI